MYIYTYTIYIQYTSVFNKPLKPLLPINMAITVLHACYTNKIVLGFQRELCPRSEVFVTSKPDVEFDAP